MYGSWFWFTFVGFPGPPRAELVYGKMKRGLVSREFGAIYVDRVAVARTGAHLGERPGEGALALYDAVKQHHFREKYWFMAFTFN